MKLNDIRNKTIDIPVDYFGDTVTLKVLANYLTPELESKLQELSGLDEDTKLTAEETQTRIADFADIVSSMVKSWDIEDAEPTKEVFIQLGIPFMTATFAAIQAKLLPGKTGPSN